MASYKTEDLRNVAIIGHSGSGKTMLAEAMLLAGKQIKRLGSVADGTTVCDHDEDAKEAQKSIHASVCHLPWKGKHINLIDTPGFIDFLGGMVVGLSGADCAVLAVNATQGIEVVTRKAWDAARDAGTPVIIAVTRMDGENVHADELVQHLRGVFGAACTPLNLPLGAGREFKGVCDLMTLPDPVPAEIADQASAASSQLMESIIASDEELMLRYLEEEEISPEEIAGAFTSSLVSGDVVPILFCAAEAGLGVAELLDVIAHFSPDPTQVSHRLQPIGDNEPQTYTPASDGAFRGLVFKVTSDDFVGKLSFIRVLGGRIAAGDTIHKADGGKAMKIAKLFRFQGKDQEEISDAPCGDIVATAKLEKLSIGDTIVGESGQPSFMKPRYAAPMVSRAVEPKSRGDEAKIAENLRRLADEDPTFRWEQVQATKETVMYGMGEQHLRVMINRLKRRGLELTTRPPRIQYRETISAHADIRYRHKKQSGGAGQFAEVAIKVEPNEREAGYEFIDEIFGGAISQNFRPSVDKGIQKTMSDGIMAGYPVVDLRVTLYDGKEHPVDSKDIAFQIAGQRAISQAVQAARPIFLEPIVRLEIAVPSRFYGDITGDISGKRGRIVGTDQLGDLNVIKAEVPLAEVQSYSQQLQALTGGEGSYTMETFGYDTVPANIAQQIIDAAGKGLKEDED